KALGGESGGARPRRRRARPAGGTAPALGRAAARDERGGLRAHYPPSRMGHPDPGLGPGPVRLARPPSYGARHDPARADGLAGALNGPPSGSFFMAVHEWTT